MMVMKTKTIYNENCLDTMAKMPDGFVDLTVTSPPYDNLRTYNDNIDKTWGEHVWKPIIKELYRVTKDGGVVVWIVGDATINGSETGTSFKQVLWGVECGFSLYDTMIYEKPPRGAVGDNNTYWQTFEYMFVLTKGKPKTINLIKDRDNKEARSSDKGTKRLLNGTLAKVSRSGYEEKGRRTNIWRYGVGKGQSTKDEEAFNHSAIFPEKLARDHIYSWSNEGDLVYDPFMGSGTTAKMAHELNRNWIGSEISKEYVDLANKRIKPYLDQYKLF